VRLAEETVRLAPLPDGLVDAIRACATGVRGLERAPE
jgi:hypothetical protein